MEVLIALAEESGPRGEEATKGEVPHGVPYSLEGSQKISLHALSEPRKL